MSTYRNYVDSRERQPPTHNTTDTIELALPSPMTIAEKSRAMIDVVCVPNSFLTVTEIRMTYVGLKNNLVVVFPTIEPSELFRATTMFRLSNWQLS